MAYTETVKIVTAPERVTLQGKSALKLRFVAKAPGKRYQDRFINGLLWGKDAEFGERLSKGDVVQISGPLGLGTYFDKKKKADVLYDEMGWGWRIERVITSATFFGPKPEAAEAEDPAREAEDTPRAGAGSALDGLDDL